MEQLRQAIKLIENQFFLFLPLLSQFLDSFYLSLICFLPDVLGTARLLVPHCDSVTAGQNPSLELLCYNSELNHLAIEDGESARILVDQRAGFEPGISHGLYLPLGLSVAKTRL